MRLAAYQHATHDLLESVRESLTRVDLDQVERMVAEMLVSTDRRIVILGAGRSGLVGRAFAMRLMHLGFQVYVTGETITPSIGRGDFIIALSGSGTTKLVVTAAEIGKAVGAKIIAVTSYADSDLAKLADQIVLIKGRTKIADEKDYFLRQLMGDYEPMAPLGTVFEISLMTFLDGVVVELMQRLGLKESELRRRHATIE
ncbi:MAG TPA: 6-phospho-3-hexuloisomerase [Candidatus Acidoferrum sp.]|nr:6-phospho-3-hexuloisomerase [Candidatus Acidoferrum sp.]